MRKNVVLCVKTSTTADAVALPLRCVLLVKLNIKILKTISGLVRDVIKIKMGERND